MKGTVRSMLAGSVLWTVDGLKVVLGPWAQEMKLSDEIPDDQDLVYRRLGQVPDMFVGVSRAMKWFIKFAGPRLRVAGSRG